MYIKLSYSSPKYLTQILRVVADIINNPSVTSISALRSRETAASYTYDLLQYLQDQYSYIVRTNSPDNTIAYMTRPAAGATGFAHTLILRQPIYDSPTSYNYTLFNNASTTSDWSAYSTVTLTSGDITVAANQWSLTEASAQSTARGTALTTSTLIASGTTMSGSSSIYTAHIYVTDYCFLMTYETSGASKSANFYSTVAQSLVCMPAAQYKRYDYWNSQANGIYPVVTDTHNSWGLFGNNTHWNTFINNPSSTTTTECMLKMTHSINALPGTATTWPILNGMRVAHGLGTRYNDQQGLQSGTLGVTAGTQNSPTYGPMTYPTTTYTQYRFPLPDLNKRGFGMFPLTFRNIYYNVVGGNITEISGFYIYLGDYCSGDEVVFNNKTYVLWCPYSNPPATTRLAIAVPKE